jgi:transcriptional regulator with XRE-family HTH domain
MHEWPDVTGARGPENDREALGDMTDQPLDSASSTVAAGATEPGGSPLRRLRMESGLSVRALAIRAEVAVSTINRIERGDRGIGARSRRQIAGALGCRESDLYETDPPTAVPFTDLLDALAKLITAGAHDIAAETAELLAARLREIDTFAGRLPTDPRAGSGTPRRP